MAGPEEGFYHLNGSLQEAKVKALSRTYVPSESPSGAPGRGAVGGRHGHEHAL